jgi:hypothetical protein
MTEPRQAMRNAAVSTGLSALAGLLGGPLLAALTGLACGLPIGLVGLTMLAVMIWLDPVTGIWLAITAATATGAFILGTLRKPPPGLLLATCRGDSGQRIARLETQLALAGQRERALLAALTVLHHSHPPAALPVPVIRGQVTR